MSAGNLQSPESGEQQQMERDLAEEAGANQHVSSAVRKALESHQGRLAREAGSRYEEEASFMNSALPDILRRARDFFGEDPLNAPVLSDQHKVWRHEMMQSAVSGDLEYGGVAVQATKYRLYDICYGPRNGVRLALLWFDCPECGRRIEGHNLPLFCLANLGQVIDRGCVDALDLLEERPRAAAKVSKANDKGKPAKAERILNRLRAKETRQHARACSKRVRYWRTGPEGRRFRRAPRGGEDRG